MCPGRKQEASTSIPVNDLKVILSVAREQYLKMIDSPLPSAATCLTDRQESTAAKNSGKKETKNKPTVFSRPSTAIVDTNTVEICQYAGGLT